jgi:hypothetical protein
MCGFCAHCRRYIVIVKGSVPPVNGLRIKVRKYTSRFIRECRRGEGDFVFGMVCFSILGSFGESLSSRALDSSLINESCMILLCGIQLTLVQHY